VKEGGKNNENEVGALGTQTLRMRSKRPHKKGAKRNHEKIEVEKVREDPLPKIFT